VDARGYEGLSLEGGRRICVCKPTLCHRNRNKKEKREKGTSFEEDSNENKLMLKVASMTHAVPSFKPGISSPSRPVLQYLYPASPFGVDDAGLCRPAYHPDDREQFDS